jgi:DNA replication and repair protein RecF
MRLTTLTLTNFRNYTSQTFEAGPGTVLLLGDNAQGKTNVLEAIFLLATGRHGIRAQTECQRDVSPAT